jgi:hypothetical protein
MTEGEAGMIKEGSLRLETELETGGGQWKLLKLKRIMGF